MSDLSKKLFERAKKVIPCGVNSSVRFYYPYPFFVNSGKGSKIITVEDKVLVDYCMGYGSILLGHAYPRLIESIKDRFDKGSLFCIPTQQEVELAELISKILPHAEMTRLVNTGSEATMHAIRLARAFTKRKKIIKFEGCYHGSYDYVLVNVNSSAPGIPSSEGSLEEAASQTLVVPYNDLTQLEEIINKNHDVACVIIEPIFANMGLILPEKGYLNGVRKLTQQKGIILIFDEVITGFRLGIGGASEFYGIKPDLVTLGKAMGNGVPISAITGREEIMMQLAPMGRVYQASTYAGNPISVVGSLLTIEILLELKNEIYQKTTRTCDLIVKGINDAIDELELNCTINTIGSMFQLFFTNEVKDAKSACRSNIKQFDLLFHKLLNTGVFIPPSKVETCFVSFSHNKDDIDKTIESYQSALRLIGK